MTGTLVGDPSPRSPATTSAPTAAGIVRTAADWFRATLRCRAHEVVLIPHLINYLGSCRNPLVLNPIVQ